MSRSRNKCKCWNGVLEININSWVHTFRRHSTREKYHISSIKFTNSMTIHLIVLKVLSQLNSTLNCVCFCYSCEILLSSMNEKWRERKFKNWKSQVHDDIVDDDDEIQNAQFWIMWVKKIYFLSFIHSLVIIIVVVYKHCTSVYIHNIKAQLNHCRQTTSTTH